MHKKVNMIKINKVFYKYFALCKNILIMYFVFVFLCIILQVRHGITCLPDRTSLVAGSIKASAISNFLEFSAFF